MLRSCSGAMAVLVLTIGGLPDASGQYAAELAKAEAPKELKDDLRKLLSDEAVRVQDGQKNVIAEIWFRKDLQIKATPEQVKNGLTYREVPESSILAVVRFPAEWTDYRKQKVNAGLYTLRLGFQPMDGDHMGTAPHTEFCLLAPAKEDKLALLEAKALHELSMRSTAKGNHPGIMLLFPPSKKPDTSPKMENRGEGVWTLNWKQDVAVGMEKAMLGISLTLAGHTTAE